MLFTYTSKRRITTGHSVDTEYKIQVGVAQLDWQLDAKGSEQRALDGTTEIDTWRLDDEHIVLTDWIPIGTGDDTTGEFEEFLASVAYGEQFLFDPDATTDTATAAQVSVVLARRRIRPRRLNLLKQYPLRLREV